jgi:aminoglycoside 6'-N-acetyltransferase
MSPDPQNHITLRPLNRQDFGRLVAWINAPHVAQWWDGQVDLNAVVEKYGPRLEDQSATTVFVIELADRPIGIIQCYRHKDYSDWDRIIGIDRAAGIDYLIGEADCTGKGICPLAIRSITAIAFALYPDVDVVVSTPQKDNRASWRALEKAGFQRIDERKLDSDCPSDAGVSYIYSLPRINT